MNKTYIIAEMAQGFEGSPELVRRMIRLAKTAGADAVKFQIFQPLEVCTPGYQYYELFRSLEIEPLVWKEAIDLAASLGIDFLADVFGAATLSWLKDTRAAGFKIHSTDVKNFELLEAIRGVKQRIFLSTGGSTFEEIQTAVDTLGRHDLTLLSGFQAEPNQLSDVELDKMNFLASRTGLAVGYADHLDAADPLAVSLPAMAVLRGATAIEKHLTIEREAMQLEDCISALNPGEFKEMVSLIRKVEQFRITGDAFPLSEREEAYRIRSKKVTCAARDIAAGEVLTPAHLALRRPAVRPESPIDITAIVGKTACAAISIHTPITADLLI